MNLDQELEQILIKFANDKKISIVLMNTITHNIADVMLQNYMVKIGNMELKNEPRKV